ncbi:ricin-type beta-trefoil lectin domain protein, partial [Jiangella rhizosphaerae]
SDPPAAAPSVSAEPEPPAENPPDEPADPPPAPPEQEEEQPPAEPPADEPDDQPVADAPVQEPDEPVEDDEPPVDQPEVEPSQPSETPTSEPTQEPTEEPTAEPTQPPAEQPPTIDQQPPPNPVVVAGETVTLTVAVSGNPPPELQWQYADPPEDTGGDEQTPAAAETSGPRFLFAPTTSGTPYVRSAEYRTGDVPADETPGDSQDVPSEEDWVDVAGATTDTLVIEEPDRALDGRLYRVKATNPLGTITTEPAVITVQYPPEIETQPQSVTVVEGGTAVFEATAVANPDAMTITWQVREPGGEWSQPDIAVATPRQEGVTSTLELTGVGPDRDGYQYRAVFTNEVGEATSEPATLTVHWQPKVTEQPESVEAGPGDDVEFTASASANPEATWAWESAPSADGPWTAIPDATGTGPDAALTRTGVTLDDDHTRYRAVFTNELGSVTTDAATLEVVRAGRFEVDLGEAGTRCLVVESTDVRAGDCANAPSRGWEAPGDGTIVWRGDPEQCLDATHPLGAVILAPCDGSASQQWEFDPSTSAAQNIYSGKYPAFVLDIEQVAADGRLILFNWHGGVNQQFRYIQP